MEIKSNSAASAQINEARAVQASRQSDNRHDEQESEFSSRKIAQAEQERNQSPAAVPNSETRFFALEDRQESKADPRLQVRAMRERVQQTYSDQEAARTTRRADREQQAQDAQLEQNTQRSEARDPIDLIA